MTRSSLRKKLQSGGSLAGLGLDDLGLHSSLGSFRNARRAQTGVGGDRVLYLREAVHLIEGRSADIWQMPPVELHDLVLNNAKVIDVHVPDENRSFIIFETLNASRQRFKVGRGCYSKPSGRPGGLGSRDLAARAIRATSMRAWLPVCPPGAGHRADGCSIAQLTASRRVCSGSPSNLLS